MAVLQLSHVAGKPKMNKEETWDFLQRMGMINSNRLLRRSYENIKDCWKDEPCFIIGGGPPLGKLLEQADWSIFDNKHTIGINHVIEDYDEFEWFFFLDKRFLERTTYDMDQYQGLIFAQCTTGLQPDDRTKIFHCTHGKPSTRLEDGLYSPNLSGLAALNLALITGANPIYLLGYGNGQTASKDAYHYKKDYTGEVKDDKIFQKFIKVQQYFEVFEPYKDRIIHVTDGNDIQTFKKMSTKTFIKRFTSKKQLVIEQNPRVVHLSFSSNIDDHADITRYAIQECVGHHSIINVNKQVVPEADLYIAEHFLSTDKFINEFKHKNKTIDIVHTVNCIPHGRFKKVIALTNAWKRWLQAHNVNVDAVISGGIDLDAYKDDWPDYNAKTFGRITRWSASKIHPQWSSICHDILEELSDAQCIIYTQLDQVHDRKPLEHVRMHYDKSCQIHMHKGQFLKNLSLYVHTNGSFKETLSFGVIEAMATGLPVVYLSEKTDVLEEVTGKAGIRCESMEQVKKAVIDLLQDAARLKTMGMLAKQQAKRFDKKQVIGKLDSIIMEALS